MLEATRLDTARLELDAEVLIELLIADERLDVVAVDDRMLEITLVACDERLDDTVLAGAELARLDEATTNDDWLDEDTVADLNAAISFFTLFNACAACASSGCPTATPQGTPRQFTSGLENFATRPLALFT